jgi:hypothetical protein
MKVWCLFKGLWRPPMTAGPMESAAAVTDLERKMPPSAQHRHRSRSDHVSLLSPDAPRHVLASRSKREMS